MSNSPFPREKYYGRARIATTENAENFRPATMIYRALNNLGRNAPKSDLQQTKILNNGENGTEAWYKISDETERHRTTPLLAEIIKINSYENNYINLLILRDLGQNVTDNIKDTLSALETGYYLFLTAYQKVKPELPTLEIIQDMEKLFQPSEAFDQQFPADQIPPQDRKGYEHLRNNDIAKQLVIFFEKNIEEKLAVARAECGIVSGRGQSR